MSEQILNLVIEIILSAIKEYTIIENDVRIYLSKIITNDKCLPKRVYCGVNLEMDFQKVARSTLIPGIAASKKSIGAAESFVTKSIPIGIQAYLYAAKVFQVLM